MVAMYLKSCLLFVALLESSILVHLHEVGNKNVAVVLVEKGGGETRACAGFAVANRWAISSSNCFIDRWEGHTKILVGKNQLSNDSLHDADARNVSGIFDHPSSRTPGGGNYSLKLFSFAPGYNQTNDVKISNATSWDDVGNVNCSVSGFDNDGAMVSVVLSANNATRCWKDDDVCFKEASGTVVECGGSVVAIAVPEGSGRKRSLEFLGRYKQWVDGLTVKLSIQRESSVNDDCEARFLIEAQDRCMSSSTMSSVVLVLGTCIFASL